LPEGGLQFQNERQVKGIGFGAVYGKPQNALMKFGV
jgi:hypothetical protein